MENNTFFFYSTTLSTIEGFLFSLLKLSYVLIKSLLSLARESLFTCSFHYIPLDFKTK